MKNGYKRTTLSCIRPQALFCEGNTVEALQREYPLLKSRTFNVRRAHYNGFAASFYSPISPASFIKPQTLIWRLVTMFSMPKCGEHDFLILEMYLCLCPGYVKARWLFWRHVVLIHRERKNPLPTAFLKRTKRRFQTGKMTYAHPLFHPKVFQCWLRQN